MTNKNEIYVDKFCNGVATAFENKPECEVTLYTRAAQPQPPVIDGLQEALKYFSEFVHSDERENRKEPYYIRQEDAHNIDAILEAARLYAQGQTAQPQGDLVLCRRVIKEPEHEGATGYEYFVPVKDAQPVDLDALKKELCQAFSSDPDMDGDEEHPLAAMQWAIDHLASRGMIVTAQQPTEDAQRALDALDRLKNHSTPYGEFEDGVTQWQYDIETIRAALARGLGE